MMYLRLLEEWKEDCSCYSLRRGYIFEVGGNDEDGLVLYTFMKYLVVIK